MILKNLKEYLLIKSFLPSQCLHIILYLYRRFRTCLTWNRDEGACKGPQHRLHRPNIKKVRHFLFYHYPLTILKLVVNRSEEARVIIENVDRMHLVLATVRLFELLIYHPSLLKFPGPLQVFQNSLNFPYTKSLAEQDSPPNRTTYSSTTKEPTVFELTFWDIRKWPFTFRDLL